MYFIQIILNLHKLLLNSAKALWIMNWIKSNQPLQDNVLPHQVSENLMQSQNQAWCKCMQI